MLCQEPNTDSVLLTVVLEVDVLATFLALELVEVGKSVRFFYVAPVSSDVASQALLVHLPAIAYS